MNEGPIDQGNMIETTDCLEAVGVFRGWKNFFFLVVFICLLLAQGAFWVIDLGLIEGSPAQDVSATAAEATAPTVENAAASAVADMNDTPATKKTGIAGQMDFLGGVKAGHLDRTIELVDGILIIGISLYCLAIFFSLMVSLIGRLGGINHVSRAFFLSLIMLVLVIPWQQVLNASVVGVIYTPAELAEWLPNKSNGLVSMVLYYLRFSVYWFVVMLLLLMSQIRSARWTKAILRRLEII
ncbi:MAG: hypothetical protein JW741_10070 [Sedimentisphaerales bacterium]|nr:hypothetical protein [Sedimentisphaerales bacterium]